MQNKIFLLLVLLIPSLCFGKSLRISGLTYEDELWVTFLDSTFGQEIRVTFPINKAKKADILLKEKDFELFKKVISFHFPKDTEKNLEKFALSEKEYGSSLPTGLIHSAILQLAVVNGYQVTIANTKNIDFFSIYLWKPNK